ncbi:MULTISPECIES: signal peptide peptidase SppA [Cyanophyceae]|uniref:signal peptide peptidase SppA n=1 Tax=Cyanophyceae TaxID=3028117 RepID=UPI00016DC786|nr:MULTISPECIES: signal peptide peptidase SppA [Cyanophyceae]ACA99131.1 signal peptide peptidase SppA, 67K type [Picosynechococcus sp. PCC 7002]SMQ84625.1 protease-4 [Synechococcus sp. 7002]
MKDFFKQVFSSCLGTLIALSLLSTLSLSAFIALIALFSAQEGGGRPKENSILIFNMGTIIQDRDPSSSIGNVIAGDFPETLSLRDVTESIRAAAEDDKITGLFLDGRQNSLNGYATLREVRQALQDFKAAGKKIYAYDVEMTEREYYLSSLADEIWLNPLGVVEMNGLGSEQLFFKGALDQYGIGVQVVRVGDYKSAVEPFTQEEFSPENRQQTEALLSDLWTDFKDTVAGDRPFAATLPQSLADTQGILLPEVAQQEQLVTRLAYFDEILAELKTFTGTELDKDLPQMDLADYSLEQDLAQIGVTSENTVAVVYAEGNIVGGEGTPDTIGGDSLSRQLRELRQDPEVKVVVLRINSPGGSAIASEIILRELKLIREADKPVIVSMGDLAASGGYWIATESDRIFAQPNTITGSIGVFGILPNIQTIGNNNGLTWDSVQTGELANLGTASRPKTEAEMAIFQNFVNDIYGKFLDRVSAARGLTEAEVRQIAQGRVWSGEDAQAIRLVDELGGLSAAIAYAVDTAELGEDFTVQEYPRPQTWEEEIFSNLFGAQIEASDPLSQEWLRLQASIKLWRSLNDPKQVYALMPWQPQID